MLTLDATSRLDLASGVGAELRPLRTALMVATRNDPVVKAVLKDAFDEERAVAFAKALARKATRSTPAPTPSTRFSTSGRSSRLSG